MSLKLELNQADCELEQSVISNRTIISQSLFREKVEYFISFVFVGDL